jgi:hypothetical protein
VSEVPIDPSQFTVGRRQASRSRIEALHPDLDALVLDDVDVIISPQLPLARLG